MAFEVGETVNHCAEWVCSSPFVYGTLSNPVVTALLITAMALAVIYAMYRDDLEGTGWRLGVKTAIWLAVGTSALIYAHYYALERRLRKKSSSQGVRDVMASIHHSASTGGGYAVRGGAPLAVPPPREPPPPQTTPQSPPPPQVSPWTPPPPQGTPWTPPPQGTPWTSPPPQGTPWTPPPQASPWAPPRASSQVAQSPQPLRTTPQAAPASWATPQAQAQAQTPTTSQTQATPIQNAMRHDPANTTPNGASATQAPSEMDDMGLRLIPPLAN